MDKDIHGLGMRLKLIYSLAGLVLGLACMIIGLVLGLSGVVGHTTMAASFIGLSANVGDAAPGVIVFVVGMFVVLITRFSVNAETTVAERPARPGAAPQPAAPVIAPQPADVPAIDPATAAKPRRRTAKAKRTAEAPATTTSNTPSGGGGGGGTYDDDGFPTRFVSTKIRYLR